MSEAALGSLTPEEISTLLWMTVGTNPTSANWNVIIGLMIQALIVSMIVLKAYDYYDHFYDKDSIYAQVIVGFGTLFSVMIAIVRAVEVHHIIIRGPAGLQYIIRFVIFAEMSNLILGAIFNTGTGAYYLYRACKMSKVARLLLPLFIAALIAQFVVSMLTVVHGYGMSTFSLDKLVVLTSQMATAVKYLKIWYATSLSVDSALCILMTFTLVKSKSSLFQNDGRLLNNLLAVIWETMLPPVICLVVLEVSYGSTSVTSLTLDWRFIFLSILPVLYFNAALHTLVGRHTIRKVLDEKLMSEGIDLLSTGSKNGKKHGYTYAMRSRDVSSTEQEYETELKHETGSALTLNHPLVQGPHRVLTSESDGSFADPSHRDQLGH